MSTGQGNVHPSHGVTDRVRWRDSLRTRIALWSGLLNLVLVLLVTLATAWFAQRSILADTRRNVRATTQEAAHRLEGAMVPITITADGLSGLASQSALEPGTLTTVLRNMVEAAPGATGGLLALEPTEPDGSGFARYIASSGQDRDFVADGYDFRAQRWYQRTLASPAGWWSEPYLHQTAGGVRMVTYNQPLRASGRGATTKGMISLDLPVDALLEQIDSLAHLPGWQVNLVAPEGTLALHANPELANATTLDDYIEAQGRSDLLAASAAIRLRQPVNYSHADPHGDHVLFSVVEPIGDSGWSLLVTQSHALDAARLKQTLLLVAAIGALLALLSTLFILRLARRVSHPVEALAASAARLAQGRYDAPVPHTTRHDEVGLMARTLEHARTSIRQQLTEIEEMGAARQKLESELSIARDIQQAMLPQNRVIDRDDAHLEAHALLEPAKAVGGDFYTFIERGEGELWFVIGDVSDKGVPAALFMARTVTVLEVAAHAANSPREALAEASQRLVEGNTTCMFATVLCGRIDVRSGDCLLASAGHDPPVLLRPDGSTELLDFPSGPPLGFEVSDDFPSWHGQLSPGTTLLAYTDGVTEAFNPANEAYGSERLLARVRPDHSAEDQCQRLIAEVHGFAYPAPQSDDITVLAIRLYQDHSVDAVSTQGDAPC